jgi:hypothetical protein
VEDENGKDIAEQEASGNQSNATEDVQAACAHWSKMGRKSERGLRGSDAGTVRECSGNRWH